MPPFRRVLLCLPLCLLALAAVWPAPAEDGEAAIVVFLVRHAEKAVDGGSDPPLIRPGLERAAELAELLRDAGITHVHSTDLLRTRRTAQPLAERLNLEVETYDPADLEALARRIRSTPGRHLVCGHSNTTPELVRRLGGEPGAAIDEATEYDRLYVLVLGEGGAPATVLLRYGG